MASTLDSVRQLVSENSPDDFIAASAILITFASNVLENPSDKKYRRIRIANSNVQSKLLNVAGGMECLFEMGFEEIEDGEFLMLPLSANLQIIKSIKDELNREVEKLNQAKSFSAPTQSILSPSAKTSRLQDQTCAVTSIRSYADSEAAFLGRMRDGMQRILHYENPTTKQKARDVLPIDSLQSEAKANLASSVGSNKKLDIRDYLLLALLSWFKKSFFHWVDTLSCSICNGVTINTGSIAPTADELRWGGSRVEAHTCNNCGQVNRFPRFTNAEKLLDTRRGRCGEWADCFTLFCRALDFEARYVMDWTDHVWTEVFSESQGRWLHCDPCENVCDKPLLYESGWGKKLTYIIAVSHEEIQDVTWRYSAKHKDVLARRTLCREPWLRRTIHHLWRQRLSSLSEERQRQLWQRLVCELTEFLTVKDGISENLPGRTTGSLAWRQARGELGSGAASRSVDQKNFVFSPSEAERESELIHVIYNCAADGYIRKSSKGEEYRGWDSCVYSTHDVFRKEELDWKMVYLAREEGSATAEVAWKFDLSETDLRIAKMELRAETAVFESGTVSWRICADDNCFVQAGATLQQFMTFDLRGCKSLSITAVMQGGKGNLAWQHTQLFRQSARDLETYPFEIKLFLN